MNKKILVIVGVMVIVGAIAYLLVSGGNDTQNKQQNTSQNSQTQPASEAPTPSIKPGSYVDYRADILSATSGTRLLFFHAPWCPQCRDLETSIKAGTIPASATIIKVDYDSNQTLRQKYGVKLQTTIVELDADGNKIDSFVAYDEPTLNAVVERLL